MNYFVVGLLAIGTSCSAWSAPSPSEPDPAKETLPACRRLILQHGREPDAILTTLEWAALYRELIATQVFEKDQPYFVPDKKTLVDLWLNPDEIEKMRRQVRRFSVGVIYDLILGELSRVAGRVGLSYAVVIPPNKEAATQFFASHVRRELAFDPSDSMETYLRAVGAAAFHTLPSLEQMYEVASDPGLNQEQTEAQLSRLLSAGVAVVIRNLEDGSRVPTQINHELVSRVNAVTSVHGSERFFMPREAGGPGQQPAFIAPYLYIDYVRRPLHQPALLVDLGRIPHFKMRTFHQSVSQRVFLKHAEGPADLGVALRVSEDDKEALLEELKPVHLLLPD